MKNIIKKYISLPLLSLALSACSGFMDINTNPNYPGGTDVNMLLPSGQIAVAGILGGEMELVGSLWSQHYTQNSSSNQYNTTVAYNISNSSYSRFWSTPYSLALPNLRNVREKAEAAKLDNYYMVSEIMTCFTYHILSNWYENIPYTEATSGEANLYPKYDQGAGINTALIARLDNAIAKASTAASSARPIAKDDLVFDGDLKHWVEFAKTLKLKLMMRDFGKNIANIQSLLNAGGFLTVDARINKFVDKENNSNPLYESDRRKLNTPNNLAACATLLNFLAANSDPRISIVYELNKETPGAYFGLNAGDRPPVSQIPAGRISRAKLEPTDAVYFTSLAETHFLQAEAWARLNNPVKAKEAYDNGVKAAFERWKSNDWNHTADAFIATGGVYEFKSGSLEVMLQSILTQKWIAAARSQAWDAYFDINRTGYPQLGGKLPTDAGYVLGELSPVVDAALAPMEFPKRMIYPKSSTDNNPNAPAAVGITVKQWWHK